MADFDSEFFIDYSSLDDFQRQLIDRKNNKSMVVSGSAGSGKSLIALHKAKQIAALGEKVGDVEDLVLKCKRKGEKPNLISANSFDGQLDKIADIIKNRALTNVGILLPFNTNDKGEWSVEYVKDYLMRKGVTCEFKYNANQDTEMDLDFHSSNPKIMTWWCAKGLQFKDVFIPGCDKKTDNRSALYVAMTRCSERLYLGYTSSLSSLFPEKSNTVYNNNEELEII